ncbi:unnamed protein product (macronuclear) [Paramecium tetraurelia]|uniref:Uncharacterized protein n=1 Tax=Paramecium tetraurelia TaxID=5888 RepID=A0CAA4_PARTE|nr:uncharacterized protein GSPATT00036501001 [Paramecium tetraurelia]CAK67721.1 unnamed protein product [Paramecium tetraurelia]|eukprot:XP_001435118.1 hypothetical protein (macronuclear) [Paramecium tetraurelia strain d4-2]
MLYQEQLKYFFMNKKQIKQDKLLKKKVLYQEYWKTIFIQSNRVKDQIKDGDTSTNIVELQSKEKTSQNNQRQEQGFEKVLSEQNHNLKFLKNENPIQENRILQQKTQSQEQNKATQTNGQIQPASTSVETQTITQKNTHLDAKDSGKKTHLVDVKKDIKSDIKPIEGNQVSSSATILTSSQEELHSIIKTQTNFGINKQQQRTAQKIEKHLNECKQINSQLLPAQQQNINQFEEKQELIQESHVIPQNQPQIKQTQKIKSNKMDKEIDCLQKQQLGGNQKFENLIHDQMQSQPQNSSDRVQQLSQTIDSKENVLGNDNQPQKVNSQHDVLNENNIKQQSDQKDQANEQNESAESVTRNQLKAVHKVMRTLNEKLHQDDMKIQVIWDEVLAQSSDLVPNFEKFIQCIQFLHKLEKAHFDSQKLTAQLL